MASKQLQSRKKVQQKYRDIACKANFFPPFLRQEAKNYVSTSYSVVWQETIEISEQRTAFIWFLAQEVDWCMKDCDKQRLQTTVSINLWKILAGHTGDWFDVKTASICTTELWDVLKSFILTSLKFKVAPYPIIVSLDTLKVRWVQSCLGHRVSHDMVSLDDMGRKNGVGRSCETRLLGLQVLCHSLCRLHWNAYKLSTGSSWV